MRARLRAFVVVEALCVTATQFTLQVSAEGMDSVRAPNTTTLNRHGDGTDMAARVRAQRYLLNSFRRYPKWNPELPDQNPGARPLVQLNAPRVQPSTGGRGTRRPVVDSKRKPRSSTNGQRQPATAVPQAPARVNPSAEVDKKSTVWETAISTTGRRHNPERKTNYCGLLDRPGVALWENDYIHELFGTQHSETRCTSESTVFVRSGPGWAYKTVHDLVDSQLPHVLIDLSDETCERENYLKDYSRFDLVFRQYSCYSNPAFRMAYTANVHIIPLGYNINMLPTASAPVSALPKSVAFAKRSLQFPRRLKWAFAGNMKGDRKRVAALFADVKPHYFGKLKAPQVMTTYADAHFVLSPRGFVSLDCLRHYEAVVAGAIPIVVGDSSELDDTFGHFLGSQSRLPPWLFCASWEAAKKEMAALLHNETALAQRHQDVVDWWEKFVQTAQGLVKEATERPTSKHARSRNS